MTLQEHYKRQSGKEPAITANYVRWLEDKCVEFIALLESDTQKIEWPDYTDEEWMKIQMGL